MSAITKTIEIAAPKPRYVTIKQNPKEPFLQFVEKIAATIERQVEDKNLREILRKQLARQNTKISKKLLKHCQEISLSLR